MQVETFYRNYFKPGKVVTDSRTIKQGDIFIALKGDNFNGNEYALQAIDSGAVVAVIDEHIDSDSKQLINVENTLKFLQDLARHHVKQSTFEVIGLTGSNGKTTTKELIYSVLSQQFRVQATLGNLNNHIGVPLTILGINTNTEYAIIEMGANHIGEIAQLCNIAQPTRGLITNIGKAHLEGFGSFEGVIKAKSELYNYISSNKGKLFINGQDSILTNLTTNYPNQVAYNISGGICSGKIASSNPLEVELTDSEKNTTLIKSKLFGEYNLQNILAATAIGLDLNMDLAVIKKGIEKYVPTNNRSQIQKLGSVTVVLDCYNANPSSMQLAIHEFHKCNYKNTLIILGEMKELGEYSREEHMKIVELVNNLEIGNVFLLGDSYKNLPLKNAKYYQTIPQILEELTKINLKDIGVLIKGSRSNRLEEVGEYLIQQLS